MADQAEPNVTGQTFGTYQIQATLGQGGMGAVYLARDTSLDRLVALKVLPGKLAADTEYVARFKREAIAAAQLDHPNIVRVFSAGESDGTHYIAMELVEGQTLHGYLAQWGPMQPVEALGACMAVAKALDYAWTKSRMIHRDIKPSNIFINTEGDVKLGDLGLVKRVGGESTEITQSGVTVGTPHYCSPEQARGEKDMDFRSDIYSLGCTLYHLLSGHMPYESAAETSPVAIMVKHVTDPPPQILQVVPACPPPVVMLLTKMLAKQPTARHQSYGELIQDLQQIITQLQSGVAMPVTGAATVALPGTASAATASRKFSPAMIYTVAGVAVAAVLAGVWFWAPWKAGKEASGKGQAVPSSESRLQAESVSGQPAKAGTPNPASTAAAPLTAPVSSEIALQKLGNVFTNAVGAEMVYIPPGEFMMGSTKEEQAWAIAHGAKEEEVKREGEVPRKTGVKEGFWMGRTEVTVGQWKQFVAETGYYTDAKNLGYTSYAPRKGQVFGRVDGASWENPSFGALPQDNHPVCCVTWNDAVAFCEWLIEREQKAGRLPAGLKVRLPTEAEWEYACRAGTQTKFWWGELLEDWKDRLNWVGTVDGFEFASPVDHYGVRGRNKFGLADMLGNVTEWCTGEYDTKRADRKSHGSNTVFRVYRGGSFIDGPGQVRCASRSDSVISSRTCSFHGFRVCYGGDVSSVTTPTASTSPVDAPKDAGILAPPETRVAALTTNPKVGDVYTLALSSNVTMELMGIPPGEFMMGSTKEERAWAKANDCKDEFMEREDEQPRKTRIRQAFWMGRTEVTVGQWKQFVAEAGYRTDAEKKGYVDFAPQKEQLWGRVVGASWKDPNFGSPPRDDHPVCCVSWNDAMAYCEWLSERERKLGRFPAGFEVRLPTEAEWEYACRAGTQSKFWWGESPEDGKDRLNWRGTPNSFQFASPVDIFGERGRNKFGLADMLGNVWEWCLDEYDPKQAHEECYKGNRLVRVSRGGGGFVIETGQVRSAFRNCDNPSFSRCTRGFRVVVGVNVSGAMTITASTSPAAVANESGILAPPETRVTALTTTPKVGEGDAFAREVTALPTEEQVKRVIAKLKELNPQFDGKEQHKIESGAVTELSFSTVAVKDISPLRALKGLKKLTLLPWVAGGARPPGALSDLSPLQGMPLTFLACGNTQVNNLAPLKGMPLTILSMDGTQVADLSPLEGMPLTILWCDKAKVTDLSPLARVKGPLKELRCDFVPERDAAVLRGIKTLEKINNMPAAAFWAKAGPASVAAVSDRRNLPATDGAQRAPLQTATAGKVNPAYAARLTPQTRAAAVQRLGGTPASETAVTRALEWMKKSQNSDGSWGGLYKVSMTGFALLAFLAHGETETSQPYGEAVGKAIKWLLDTGQRNGGKLSLQHPEYQHPIAVSPLCEAYALTQNAALLPPLEKAVALIVNSQCSNGSWDYGYNTKGRNDDKRPGGDTSISSWNIQALKAAQRAGVKTPGMEACMSKALDFLREVYDAKTGRFGYATRSGGSPALVAAGAYCMHLLGVGDSKETRGALGSLRSVKGDWTKANESSTYGWYYATFATFHAGGSHWVSWNREFRDELVKHQNADGSWSVPGSNGKEPPVAARGFAQIRDPQDAAVYHTAVLTLMLESYYRFTPSTR